MAEHHSATSLVSGRASGRLLFSQTSLSFWGGVNSSTGQIVDHHHPLCGQYLKDQVLAIPGGRGSCSGSAVVLELLSNGNGPKAFIFQYAEHILTLGVLVSQTLFDISVPVIVLDPASFSKLRDCTTVVISGSTVVAGNGTLPLGWSSTLTPPTFKHVNISSKDEEILAGSHGAAAQVAMEIIVKFAQIQGAEELLDITQAHIDSSGYNGPACLRFAQKLAALGGRYAVPTTINAISVDYRRWKELGVAEEFAGLARDLADAYVSMGAKQTFTCAPYLLDSAPKIGQAVAWGESNAVVFANSVLGARTLKYPDLLEVCVALTGRAPLSGPYLDSNRRPNVAIFLPDIRNDALDDSAWAVIGYVVGEFSGSQISLVHGLEHTSPRVPDLKGFGAAFATTASAPMFHIRGITPESAAFENENLRQVFVSNEDFATAYRNLNTALDPSVGLISLGNPHFAIEEFADLVKLCSYRQKHPKVKVAITTNRTIQEQAEKAGYLEELFKFGAEVITDTCWCMIDEPIIPVGARNLMTNSGKYAHYATGMVRRGVHFGSLAQCVDAACTGSFHLATPRWLDDSR